MRIAIGSDHAGFLLKQTLEQWLLDNGYEVTDLGTYSEDRVDYPHYGALVGQAVARGEVDRGVAVCGSGQGICMAANKVPGVRGRRHPRRAGRRDDAPAQRRQRGLLRGAVHRARRRGRGPEGLPRRPTSTAAGTQGRVEKLARLDETHGASDV